MRLKDAPVGAMVHICSMFFVGDFKVIAQDGMFTECVQVNGASAEEMEYYRRGKLPPKGDRRYTIDGDLDVSIVDKP